MLKGARLVAAMTALLLCGCVASRRGDEGDVATSLPQALEQFRADDGLLMVPQLADGTPTSPRPRSPFGCDASPTDGP